MDMREAHDDYPHVVIDFGDGWRVVECSARIQWVLQRSRILRGKRWWRSLSFCRTKEALLRVCQHSHPVLDALPDRFLEGRETASKGGNARFREGVATPT